MFLILTLYFFKKSINVQGQMNHIDYTNMRALFIRGGVNEIEDLKARFPGIISQESCERDYYLYVRIGQARRPVHSHKAVLFEIKITELHKILSVDFSKYPNACLYYEDNHKRLFSVSADSLKEAFLMAGGQGAVSA